MCVRICKVYAVYAVGIRSRYPCIPWLPLPLLPQPVPAESISPRKRARVCVCRIYKSLCVCVCRVPSAAATSTAAARGRLIIRRGHKSRAESGSAPPHPPHRQAEPESACNFFHRTRDDDKKKENRTESERNGKYSGRGSAPPISAVDILRPRPAGGGDCCSERISSSRVVFDHENFTRCN